MPLLRKIVVAKKKPVVLAKPAIRTIARPKVATATKGTLTDAQRAAQAGFDRSKEERARGNMLFDRLRARPLNFFLPQGESATVVVLDAVPHFFYEHRWKGPEGKWNRMEVCLKEDNVPCPACAKLGKPGTWVMALTMIDTRPYTPKSGPNAGKTIKRSRKLLLGKGNVLDKWDRWFQTNGRNFRGAVFKIHRSKAQKSANSGDDFDFVKRLTEAEIATYGKELTQLTDYEKAFKPLAPDELSYVLGNKGSKAVGAEELEEEPHDDEIPF